VEQPRRYFKVTLQDGNQLYIPGLENLHKLSKPAMRIQEIPESEYLSFCSQTGLVLEAQSFCIQ
jgi:hypothetical protein